MEEESPRDQEMRRKRDGLHRGPPQGLFSVPCSFAGGKKVLSTTPYPEVSRKVVQVVNTSGDLPRGGAPLVKAREERKGEAKL